MDRPVIGNYRWTICALVFGATTINYLDRQVLSLLKGDLERTFHWTESDYANMVIAFQLSYALGMLGVGRLIDRVGSKIGYALSTGLWSIAAMAHALAQSTLGFAVARAGLGITEAGNFPAAVKTVAEWFPARERALATGIFNSGANVGAIIAPLTVPWIAAQFGWKWAFLLTGLIGFIWLLLWWLIYDVPAKHKKLSAAEYAYIQEDDDVMVKDETLVSAQQTEESTSWLALLRRRPTWAFALGKFLTDPVWWFYLFWFPSYLQVQYQISGTQAALPLATVYCFATVGSILGGWMPLRLVKKGLSVARARTVSMLMYACGALPILSAPWFAANGVWISVALVGFACAAHQAWSANLFTLVSDHFSKRAIASVTGIGTMFGALSGILFAKIAGLLFDYYQSIGLEERGYQILFVYGALAYLIAWLLLNWLNRPTIVQDQETNVV